jgi:hypothetical protein
MTPWREPMNNARHGQLGVIGWLRTEVFVSSNSSLGASFEHHPSRPINIIINSNTNFEANCVPSTSCPNRDISLGYCCDHTDFVISLPIDVRLATIFAKTVKPFPSSLRSRTNRQLHYQLAALDRARRARYTIYLFTAFFQDLVRVTFCCRRSAQ